GGQTKPSPGLGIRRLLAGGAATSDSMPPSAARAFMPGARRSMANPAASQIMRFLARLAPIALLGALMREVSLRSLYVLARVVRRMQPRPWPDYPRASDFDVGRSPK